MNIQKRICAVLLLAAVIASASGCGAWGRSNNGDMKPLSENEPVRRLSSGPMQGQLSEKHLARIADGVSGVEGAVVVMQDMDVAVGITIDNAAKRRVLEQQVYSALLWQFPEYRYHVTADKQLYAKLQEGGDITPLLDTIDRQFIRR
ncbi:hypothetical protein [Paenibacillus sp. HB172176]|uniref:hypothetical protein n=1 Tax=Paenibacillus sp. HB172176 TaxID=2493690 RepID=UPI00143BB234|nr:hypothetical protein [Paenibacillus sp. HB172176]